MKNNKYILDKETEELYKAVVKIEKNYKPLLEATKAFNSQAQEISQAINKVYVEPYTRIAEAIAQAQKNMLITTTAFSQLSENIDKALIQPGKIFAEVFEKNTSGINRLFGLIAKIPLDDYTGNIDTSTTYKSNLKSVKVEDSSILTTHSTTKTTHLREVDFVTKGYLDSKFEYFENKLGIKDDKVLNTIKENKTLKEKLQQFEKAGLFVVGEVQKLAYVPKTTNLFINALVVPITAERERQVCEVLFRSEKSLVKTWPMDEIIEEIEGDTGDWPDTKKWQNKIRQGANRLNDYIEKESLKQVKKLVEVYTKSLRVNPKHLPKHLQ